YVAEALVRSGVGTLDVIDKDVVSESNINRQIIALHSTVGQLKTEVFARRAKDINPNVVVHTHNLFFLPETADEFDFSCYDYVVDAIDTVSGKLAIIEKAKGLGIPVISSMGTGNKLDPTAFAIADISETSVCPLARVMRRELRKRGIEKVKVLYSKEEAMPSSVMDEESGKPVPGSISFVPSVAGLIIASEVVKDLLKGE
ncbi:MAG: tRNA threonylcarbamoyladenosine dehydratase, partial [Clostridia bacterium]|nr:tRNA threonylcarbamoyladenosine dehydratase [Clostridia bacterium]